jgi:hypothetical protein
MAGLPGVQPMGPAEQFGPAQLADKINGKAELYLPAGFEHLTTQRFKLNQDPGLWFELFHYQMGSPANAFAVFSSQRRDDSQGLDFVAQGYATANALFMVLGSDYYELIGSGAHGPLADLLEAGARALARNLAQDSQSGDSVRSEDLFPGAGQVPQSLTLIASDGFGFAGLDQVYTARFQIPAGEFTAYVSPRASADAAQELARAYGQFLLDFGGRKLAASGLPEGCQAIDILDLKELICSQGAYLYGIHESLALEGAADLIQALADNLKARSHDPQ